MSWKRELAGRLDPNKTYTIKQLVELSEVVDVQNFHQSFKRWNIQACNKREKAHKFSGKDLVLGMWEPLPAEKVFAVYLAVCGGRTEEAVDLLKAYLPERVAALVE